jgi:hypothetical protein
MEVFSSTRGVVENIAVDVSSWQGVLFYPREKLGRRN